MALTERFFPVMRNEYNFFDDLFRRMKQEMSVAQMEMEAMRKQMFHLLPHDHWDVLVNEITPRVPIIEEKGETKLKLEFDVSQFQPDEVQVKILGNNILQVYAKHEEKSEKGESHRTYVRQYSLPKGVDAEKIRPTLTKDGVLTVEAPAPTLTFNERMIPIAYKTEEKMEEKPPGTVGSEGGNQSVLP